MEKIKIGKKSWLTIIIGAVAIAVSGLSLTYFRQVNQYDQMREQYVQTQANLEQVQITTLLLNKAELEGELSEVTLQREKVQAQLSIPMASSIITKTLFGIAEKHNLEVRQMTSSVPSDETLEGVDLSQTTLAARIEGDSANFISFIVDLDRHFNTGVFRSVNMVIPEDPASASMEFSMYIYTIRR